MWLKDKRKFTLLSLSKYVFIHILTLVGIQDLAYTRQIISTHDLSLLYAQIQLTQYLKTIS